MQRRDAVAFAAVALCAAPFGVAAQAKSVSIRASGRWRTGDEIRYERVKTRADSSVAGLQTWRTPLAIRVLEGGETANVVSWRYGATRADSVQPVGRDVFEAMQQAVDDLAYVLQLDHNGGFRALRNWEEVRDRTLAAVDAAVAPAAGASAAQVRSELGRMFAGRKSVETFLLREIQLFFLFHGWDLDEGDVERWDDELPNPLGGAPLPAKATLRPARIDADRALVRYEVVFDRARAGAVLAASLARAASAAGAPPAAQLATIARTLDVHDTAELDVDRTTRWPTRLVHERRIRLADRRRTDTLTFTRLA